jgi:hypothetical protein
VSRQLLLPLPLLLNHSSGTTLAPLRLTASLKTLSLADMIDFRPPHHITTKEEWDFIFKTQIENCAKLKNTEAQYYTCIDSTGKTTRKVVIEFDD